MLRLQASIMHFVSRAHSKKLSVCRMVPALCQPGGSQVNRLSMVQRCWNHLVLLIVAANVYSGTRKLRGKAMDRRDFLKAGSAAAASALAPVAFGEGQAASGSSAAA